jgi:hypothetical protein
LKLSAETEYGHAFRQGLLAKLFEQSLWRFVHSVRRLKPMSERVKGGQAVLQGGWPIVFSGKNQSKRPGSFSFSFSPAEEDGRVSGGVSAR